MSDQDDAGIDREALEELQSRMQTASVTHRNEEVRLELRNWSNELGELLENSGLQRRYDHSGREPEDTDWAEAVLKDALGEDYDGE